MQCQNLLSRHALYRMPKSAFQLANACNYLQSNTFDEAVLAAFFMMYDDS